MLLKFDWLKVSLSLFRCSVDCVSLGRMRTGSFNIPVRGKGKVRARERERTQFALFVAASAADFWRSLSLSQALVRCVSECVLSFVFVARAAHIKLETTWKVARTIRSQKQRERERVRSQTKDYSPVLCELRGASLCVRERERVADAERVRAPHRVT